MKYKWRGKKKQTTQSTTISLFAFACTWILPYHTHTTDYTQCRQCIFASHRDFWFVVVRIECVCRTNFMLESMNVENERPRTVFRRTAYPDMCRQHRRRRRRTTSTTHGTPHTCIGGIRTYGFCGMRLFIFIFFLFIFFARAFAVFILRYTTMFSSRIF